MLYGGKITKNICQTALNRLYADYFSIKISLFLSFCLFSELFTLYLRNQKYRLYETNSIYN